MATEWTGAQRYQKSIAYLSTVDLALAQHVDQNILGNKAMVGAGLSLSGEKRYAMFGNKTVGMAVRALMLCHRAYLGNNWAKGTGNQGAGVPADCARQDGDTLTKNKYLHGTEAAVQTAIRAYVALNPATAVVADAAELVGNGTSPAPPPYETLTRAPTNFPSGQVCFNCVYWWLFKSGFVSLRWILRHGFRLGAENANELLGDGNQVHRHPDGSVPHIARGVVINWRGDQPDTKNICHWAVSLGDGRAIGANNSPGGRVGDRDVIVDFDRDTGAIFGIFDIRQMWDVYAGQKTYSPAAGRPGCIVATVDPSTVPNRNTG